MDKPVVWLPQNPCPPIPFDVQGRITELRTYLDPNSSRYQRPEQHENIKALITLYEEGKINGGDRVYIQKGKIIQREHMLKDPGWTWAEGTVYQRSNKCAYDHEPFGNNGHAVSNTFFSFIFKLSFF